MVNIHTKHINVIGIKLNHITLDNNIKNIIIKLHASSERSWLGNHHLPLRMWFEAHVYKYRTSYILKQAIFCDVLCKTSDLLAAVGN